MNRANIDLSTVFDWDDFHDLFSVAFGFPDYYGRNLNAWIDCMEEFAMNGSSLVLCITGMSEFKQQFPDIHDAFMDSSSFINFRAVEARDTSFLVISYG